MASALIHLAIAKELENRRHHVRNAYDYYLGSIAPDLAKQIGLSKEEAHFIKNTFGQDIPNLRLFEMKYPNFRNNDFDLGYYLHLYTDKEWKEDFMSHITYDNSIRLLDGTVIASTPKEILQLIYSDYTNLNIKIIEEYDLDLSLFYEDFKVPTTTIDEIPVEKLDVLINKMGIIIQNSKEEKTYSLEIQQIKDFISRTVDKIEKELDII
ncbi:MAG: hypothetical protein IKF71_05720 [Bacilli bacterium]|nr:hypothetical protein [Bacilli bacterium]